MVLGHLVLLLPQVDGPHSVPKGRVGGQACADKHDGQNSVNEANIRVILVSGQMWREFE